MIIRNHAELVELHTALRRVASSKHRTLKPWALRRIATLEAGAALTEAEANDIRAAEAEAFPAERVPVDEQDSGYAQRLATHAIPIADLLIPDTKPDPSRPIHSMRRGPQVAVLDGFENGRYGPTRRRAPIA
jgi:hypothetical protein